MTAAPHSDDQPFPTRLVALPVPPDGGFTADDLPRLMETVDGPFELLDGDVVMMAPATFWHNQAVDRLTSALAGQAPSSVVVAREAGVKLGASVPIPDVLALAREAVAADAVAVDPDAALLAVEVVSPRTKTKDRKPRPAQYADAGIGCFWRVENEDDAMVVYTFELLPEGGAYVPTGVHRHRVTVDKPFPIDIELPPIAW